MPTRLLLLSAMMWLGMAALFADNVSETSSPRESRVSTLATSDLRAYAEQPEAVRRLIAQGLTLTRQDLGYRYGSADPANGGMDCSGTIYYLLTQAGLKEVPRDAGGIYRWAWQAGHFHAVMSRRETTFELELLKPGDLLFWTGTYHIDRDPPITHVMIYLGVNEKTGHRAMVGASDGRTFNGVPRYGVSVFDFKMPVSPGENEAHFIGYSPIPDLGKGASE